MIRRLDCWPVGTDRSSSHPRYRPSTISVLPPGSVPGTSAMTVALLNPRELGIGSMTAAPLLNVSSESRSCAASNELMNVRDASRTAGHRHPIEPETSSTSERSTIRRVASPELLTVTCVKLPSLMNEVGMTAVALMVMVLTPVDAFVVNEKNDASAKGFVTDVVPMYPDGKLAWNTCAASSLGLPLLRLRAADSAAPSTALVSCALTT